MSRVMVPVRYAAWLSGDLGKAIEASLKTTLDKKLELVNVSRLPRGLLVECATPSPGILVDACVGACKKMESQVAKNHPVFHHEMGPVWTGTLQAIIGVA